MWNRSSIRISQISLCNSWRWSKNRVLAVIAAYRYHRITAQRLLCFTLKRVGMIVFERQSIFAHPSVKRKYIKYWIMKNIRCTRSEWMFNIYNIYSVSIDVGNIVLLYYCVHWISTWNTLNIFVIIKFSANGNWIWWRSWL